MWCGNKGKQIATAARAEFSVRGVPECQQNKRAAKQEGQYVIPTVSALPRQRPRFAAPYAQRSELKAQVNNALLGAFIATQCDSAAPASRRTAAVW